MKYSYNADIDPPAMILAMTVCDMEGNNKLSFNAKIDTGADMTALPENLIKKLGVKPQGHVQARGAFDKELQDHPTYFVNLDMDDGKSIPVDVITTPFQSGLLGRDVLNDYILIANGPEELFELK